MSCNNLCYFTFYVNCTVNNAILNIVLKFNGNRKSFNENEQYFICIDDLFCKTKVV
jgi:hypothetical protein